MKPEERCPYCGSENIVFEDSRLDFISDMLIETDFCKCEGCKKKFNTETDYIPSVRRYYNPSSCDTLKKEVLSNE